MQPVIFHPFLPDRLECPQSDMQRDLCRFNSSRFHAGQNFGREVQARGGRSHRTFFLGINGLVTLSVSWSVGPTNVRRKRHMADAFDFGKEILHGGEPDAAFSETASGQNFRLQLVLLTEKQALSDSDLSSGAYQALPFVG